MKLSNVLLSALLLGIAVETTSCSKKDEVKVLDKAAVDNQSNNNPNNNPQPNDCCPACGMG
jgi:hypothetical protein